MDTVLCRNALLALAFLAAAGCSTLNEYEDLPPAPVNGRVEGVEGRGTRGEGKSAPPKPAREAGRPAAPRDAPRAATPAPPPTTRHAVPAERPAPLPQDVAVAAQVLLDRANFSVGCIDGRWGPRSVAALSAWQAGLGLPPTGQPDPGTLALLGDTNSVMTVHVVDVADHEGLAPVPTTWPEKAAAPRMGYATVLERIAEKYHATERFIRELNPAASWPHPEPGTVLTVPNPQPVTQVKAARLTIRLGAKVVEARDGQGRLVARFPCSIAADKNKRPVGVLTVANAAHDPNYTFDPAVYPEDPEAQKIGRKLVIPPGPNNPVGEAWIGLSLQGYGMHGTPKPEDIGITESHGCFRLANWNAEKLLRIVSIGMPVVVEE